MTKSKFWWRRATLGAIAAVAMASVGAPVAAADEFTGAGATFPAPVYTRWAEQYAAAGGDTLNYQAVGSGAGRTQIANRTVDFGASDSVPAPDWIASNNLVMFPAVIGSVVVAVNIPGVDGNALKLTGPIVADIYLGRIRMWNDGRIAAINPGVSLPAVAIAPVYRADSSGTSDIFTTYLSAVSLSFNTITGHGSSVSFRAGIGAPGNAGVAGAIQNTRGGIGYVEYAYATENSMQTPMLQNRSGQFVRPTPAAFAASAAQAPWATAVNMAPSMINTLGAANWPIVSATYILVPKAPADGARAARVLRFFDWAFNNGQAAADQLHYIMLPAEIRQQVRARWAQVQAGGHPVYSGQ